MTDNKIPCLFVNFSCSVISPGHFQEFPVSVETLDVPHIRGTLLSNDIMSCPIKLKIIQHFSRQRVSKHPIFFRSLFSDPEICYFTFNQKIPITKFKKSFDYKI